MGQEKAGLVQLELKDDVVVARKSEEPSPRIAKAPGWGVGEKGESLDWEQGRSIRCALHRPPLATAVLRHGADNYSLPQLVPDSANHSGCLVAEEMKCAQKQA